MVYTIWYTSNFYVVDEIEAETRHTVAATLHTKRYAQQPGLYRNSLCSTEDNISGPSGVGIRGDDTTNVGPLKKTG